jgi:hypothetical protein
MRPQPGEQLIEPVIGDRPWNPGHDFGPIAAAALMRPRPGASTGTGQGEGLSIGRVPVFQMEVVEATQHTLAVRNRYRSIPVAVRGLARPRIHYFRPRCGVATRPDALGVPPMRSHRLKRHLQPTAEIPRFDLGCLISNQLQGPEESKPTQQVHAI